MSSFVDDQAEEIEVLQSIFPTEFEQLENQNKFKIHISPGGDEVHGKMYIVYNNNSILLLCVLYICRPNLLHLFLVKIQTFLYLLCVFMYYVKDECYHAICYTYLCEK